MAKIPASLGILVALLGVLSAACRASITSGGSGHSLDAAVDASDATVGQPDGEVADSDLWASDGVYSVCTMCGHALSVSPSCPGPHLMPSHVDLSATASSIVSPDWVWSSTAGTLTWDEGSAQVELPTGATFAAVCARATGPEGDCACGCTEVVQGQAEFVVSVAGDCSGVVLPWFFTGSGPACAVSQWTGVPSTSWSHATCDPIEFDESGEGTASMRGVLQSKDVILGFIVKAQVETCLISTEIFVAGSAVYARNFSIQAAEHAVYPAVKLSPEHGLVHCDGPKSIPCSSKICPP